MRKIVLLLIIPILFVGIINVSASTKARTLGELKKELQALKNKQSSYEYQKKKTKNQINSADNEIKYSRTEITRGQNQIEEAKKEIERLDKELLISKEKMKTLMNSYQKNEGENIYLEYLFESKSYGEFIYRYTIIKQLADFTEEQITQMKDDIKTNEELQESLKKSLIF